MGCIHKEAFGQVCKGELDSVMGEARCVEIIDQLESGLETEEGESK